LASQICKVLGNSNYVMHFKLDEQRITCASLSPTVCDRRDCALSNEMFPVQYLFDLACTIPRNEFDPLTS
jgi:hypothetical protein